MERKTTVFTVYIVNMILILVYAIVDYTIWSGLEQLGLDVDWWFFGVNIDLLPRILSQGRGFYSGSGFANLSLYIFFLALLVNSIAVYKLAH